MELDRLIWVHLNKSTEIISGGLYIFTVIWLVAGVNSLEYNKSDILKMKRFLIITIIIIAGSCSRDEVKIFPPEGDTKAVTNITENSATLNGSVIAYGVATKVSFFY